MASNIFQTALEMLNGGENAALVTIVSAEGFVPVSATSKLLSSWTKIFMYITVSVLMVPYINRVSAG